MAHPCDGMRAAELRGVIHTDVRAELRANFAIISVLAILAISLAIDLVMDLDRRPMLFHASVERSAIIAAAIGVVLGARQRRTALHEAQDLREPARIRASSNASGRRA
jgi:hypothetical protein